MRLSAKLGVMSLAVAVVGCTDEARIAKAGERCNGGDLAACSQLEQLAKGDGSRSEKDGARRMMAVHALTEQGALGRVALMLAEEGLDGGCAYAAAKLRDKAALIRLADDVVRRPAMPDCPEATMASLRSVLNERELFDLAMTRGISFESEAVEHIRDESLLMQLMRKPGKEFSVTPVVEKKINDQGNLTAIATGVEFDESTRHVAIGKLTDRQLLGRLAKDPGLTGYYAKKRLDALGKT